MSTVKLFLFLFFFCFLLRDPQLDGEAVPEAWCSQAESLVLHGPQADAGGCGEAGCLQADWDFGVIGPCRSEGA